MFDTLSDKLQGVFRTLRGQGTLSESRTSTAPCARSAWPCSRPTSTSRWSRSSSTGCATKATGQEVLQSLTPAQAVIRIVRDEMVELLGGDAPARLAVASRLPSVVLMTGLQGSGKTTTSAKLGAWLAKGGHHPLLVSTDVYRPAAREQLRTLGRRRGLQGPPSRGSCDEPRERSCAPRCGEARAHGPRRSCIVDTAGRLHIDDELMARARRQLQGAAASRAEVLYVADAMTGQDAVKSAEEFHGASASPASCSPSSTATRAAAPPSPRPRSPACPVKFAGVGERVDEFELFQPERMVGRILGMGDVLGLIERAEEVVDRETGRGDGPQAPAAQRVHARGLPRPAGAGAEDGPARPGAGHDPGHVGTQAKDVDTAAGRARDAARRGHHRLHDRRASGASPRS